MTQTDRRTLLADAAHSGVFRIDEAESEALRGAATELGFIVFPLDLTLVTDKEGLLSAFALGLDFPDWFGHNWDALEDCLTDLSWWPAPGYVLLLDHPQALCAQDAESVRTAVEILRDVSDAWRTQDVAFWTFLSGLPASCAQVRRLP